MAALTRSDLESAFGFLAEAETVGGRDPFPAELLATFAALIPCDFVSYTELDLANQSFIASVSVPAVADPTGAGTYWRVMDKHPLRGAQGSAAKLSDFVSVRELHRLQVYTRTTSVSGTSSTNSSCEFRRRLRSGGPSSSSAAEETSQNATGSSSICFVRISCGCGWRLEHDDSWRRLHPAPMRPVSLGSCSGHRTKSSLRPSGPGRYSQPSSAVVDGARFPSPSAPGFGSTRKAARRTSCRPRLQNHSRLSATAAGSSFTE